MTLTNIGLSNKSTDVLVIELNALLANYQIFYMNVRGYHWNIKGSNFFELHAKFEEIYTNLLTKIDDIAERISTLGGQPLHAYSQYIKQSKIQEHINVFSTKDTVAGLLAGIKNLLMLQRQILQLANESDDEGTSSLMSDYIKEQEKTVWIFSAFANQ